MTKKKHLHIGCSGWNYRHWRGRFYPEDQAPKDWFGFYAKVFDTVEINNTFYRLPTTQTFQDWQAQAPAGFLYAVKANRYLTHLKKLTEPTDALKNFLDRARLLKEHLGPILYQLPPHWRLNRERLESFLALLPRELIHVLEFREQSWMVEEVFQLLEKYGVSFCTHDMAGLDVPRRSVGPVAYVRFHGTGQKYHGSYSAPALQSWWEWMEQQARDGKELYVYFNNDVEAHAVRDAVRLKQMAGCA